MNKNFTPANPDIIQTFVEMQESYPPLYESENDYPSVKAWLKIIRTQGFSSDMMQEVLGYCFKLIKSGKYEESAQLILVSCATRNDNACHVLGRELFKGKLFATNTAASFGLLLNSAQNGNAEAICDLALFYKNGINAKKNKKYALKLYKQAMEAGVERAKEEYEMLK